MQIGVGMDRWRVAGSRSLPHLLPPIVVRNNENKVLFSGQRKCVVL